MITIAHLSDVHLAPMPRVALADLLNKRMTGFLNWQLNRRDYLRHDLLDGLLEHLRMQNPDFTAVTGDLVNLALEAEIAAAAGWLKQLGPPKKVAVVPGNHDAYVPGALALEQKLWGDYMDGERLDGATFPYVRRIGDVAVIGCSSAVPTPPFFASGTFEADQADRLERCLKLLGEAEFFRIILIHHPPAGDAAHSLRKGLRGADLFEDAIASAGAELVLHGHLHKSSITSLPGPHDEIPVVGVAAASASSHDGEDPARYNLFRIRRNGAKWSCQLTEFGYQRIGSEVTQRLQMKLY